ncbi:MAG: aminoacyl-tRNA deacylase [Betaproteobacteria bacterium]
MSIPYRVQDFMAERDIPWDPVPHEASDCSMDAAHLAHVKPDELAKAVVLRTGHEYLLAVVPADRRVDLAAVEHELGRHVTLASESALDAVMPECARGAVPAVGQAFGIPTIWDPSLADEPDVYFEGGDHRTLVHMSGATFGELMRTAQPLRCTRH